MAIFSLIFFRIRYHSPMYIETVPNPLPARDPAARELSEDGKVKKRTLLNLSDWPAERVEGLRGLLKGGVVLPPAAAVRHRPLAAAWPCRRRAGDDPQDRPRPAAGAEGEGNRPRDLVLAMIVSRIIAPASKLATVKGLNPPRPPPAWASAGLGEVAEDELYEALDWLLARQAADRDRARQAPSEGRHAGAL